MARTSPEACSSTAAKDATVYTDEALHYHRLDRTHRTVTHSVGQYVNGQAHTNGMESFWSLMKRGYHGVYHRMSPWQFPAYVGEFAGRHNDRPLDTIDQMTRVVRWMDGRRLRYKDLIARNPVPDPRRGRPRPRRKAA